MSPLPKIILKEYETLNTPMNMPKGRKPEKHYFQIFHNLLTKQKPLILLDKTECKAFIFAVNFGNIHF